ncbi:MAG: hypothetical protein V7607_5181 [Solirubrobacteraceae bacterium]
MPSGLSSDLLERDTELRALQSAFAKASAGSGCLVTIEGPASQGKSALVAVAADHTVDSVRLERFAQVGHDGDERLPARGGGGTVVAPCMRRRHFGPAAAGGGGGEL